MNQLQRPLNLGIPPATDESERPRILAIDPGTTESGWVDYHGGIVIGCGVMPNEDLLEQLTFTEGFVYLAVELFEPRGMGVGVDSIETVIWTGRFIQQWHSPDDVIRVKRSQVKSHLCGSQKANGAAIRAVLIDLFGPGKEKAIGRKHSPGPLYHVRGHDGHAFSSLAIAITAEAQLTDATQHRAASS